jgi:phosphatidylserine/phosphatidylglycerophosphate/cardiolipin synthase-like enzyme
MCCRNLLILLLCFCAIVGCRPRSEPDIQVYFSPGGGATDSVVKALNGAKKSVHVQAYSFTSAPIAKALVDAHRREVKVKVILDDSQRGEKYSSADFLDNSGIKPRIDARHAIAHNKVIIIDEEVVITGSFNFTRAAEERNAENLLVITDGHLAKKYLSNWSEHAAHSEGYTKSATKGADRSSQKEKDSLLEWETWRRFFEEFTKKAK